MLENFQLTAITKQGAQMSLLRIPLHQVLQSMLAESWQAQYDSFVSDIQEIEFNAGYNPEEHERFRLQDYDLPAWLAGEDSQTVADLEAISDNETSSIRSRES